MNEQTAENRTQTWIKSLSDERNKDYRWLANNKYIAKRTTGYCVPFQLSAKTPYPCIWEPLS